MVKIKALIIAVITIVASLGFLVFFTSYWETVGWLGLWIYTGIMIAIFGGWILMEGTSGIKRQALTTMDFTMIAMFVALIRVVDYGSMFVPGLTFLWYSLPQIAGPILFYFPLGIVTASALKLSPKPGTAFILWIVSTIVSQVFFFNPVWLARGLMAALSIEAYYLSSKRGTTGSLLLMGLTFGIMYNSSAVIYQMYTWGLWKPLFITLPTVIMAGIMMTVGAFLGFALGERAKNVMY